MLDETLEELRTSIAAAHEALKRELAKIRTGRAHPSLLDSIRVEAYGEQMPLSQMATINVPEARLLTVKPWDKTNLKAIERAIVTSPLDLMPQNDGEIIRVPMPPLTEERRKDLVKLTRREAEEAKIAVRKARHNAKDMLTSLVDEGEVGEDDAKRAEKALEEIVQKATAVVDEIIARKEKDILEL